VKYATAINWESTNIVKLQLRCR